MCTSLHCLYPFNFPFWGPIWCYNLDIEDIATRITDVHLPLFMQILNLSRDIYPIFWKSSSHSVILNHSFKPWPFPTCVTYTANRLFPQLYLHWVGYTIWLSSSSLKNCHNNPKSLAYSIQLACHSDTFYQWSSEGITTPLPDSNYIISSLLSKQMKIQNTETMRMAHVYIDRNKWFKKHLNIAHLILMIQNRILYLFLSLYS